MALKLLPLLARREVDLVDVERRSAEWGLLGLLIGTSMLWGGSSCSSSGTFSKEVLCGSAAWTSVGCC